MLPLILLGFPVLDTLTVMAQRISERRSPFSPDKNHFHHRLLRLGLFQTEAVFVVYVIQVLLILFAWFFRFYSESFLLGSYVVFSTLVVGFFTLAGRTGWQFRRFDIIDRVVKGKLRDLRERRLVIRIVFRGLHIMLPVLLVVLTIFAGNHSTKPFHSFRMPGRFPGYDMAGPKRMAGPCAYDLHLHFHPSDRLQQ